MNFDSLIQKRLGFVLSVAAGVSAVNLAVYFLGVSRLDKHARDTRTAVVRLREQVDAAEKQDREVSETVARIRADRQVVDDLSSKILTTRAQRLVAMQTELQALLEAHRLQADNISYGYKVLPDRAENSWGRRYLKVTMQIPLEGGYQDLKAFLKATQASPQFFLCEQMTLSSGSQGGATQRMNLVLSTYFVATDQDLREKAEAGADAQGGAT